MSKDELNEKVCKIIEKLAALEHTEAHLLVRYVHAPSEKNVSLERKIDDVIKSSEDWKRSLKCTIEKLVALAPEEDAESSSTTRTRSPSPTWASRGSSSPLCPSC